MEEIKMPKIPTFTATAEMTNRSSAIQTNLQASMKDSPLTALEPAIAQTTKYYLKQRDILEKTEAKKKALEVFTEADTIVADLENNSNEEESLSIFNEKFNTILNTKLGTTDNSRIKSLLQNTVDINLPKRITNVKTNSRNALEKDLEITHNNTQNVLSNEYLVATDAPTKTTILDQAINEEIDYGNQIGLSKIQTQENVDKIKQSYLISDVNKLLENKQYAAADAILKNTKDTPFLDVEQRKELLVKVEEGFKKDLAQANINNLIINKVASEAVGAELENIDGKIINKKNISSGLNKLVLETNNDGSPKYSTSQIIEFSIGNNASVPIYKESLIAGTANMTDTGDQSKVLQGFQLYKLFKVQNADEVLMKTYNISQSDIESYEALDYSINTLGETFESALNRQIRTRAGDFKERNIDDKKIDSRINELDFQGRSLLDFGSPDVNNIQVVENILKYTANMYYKAGGSEDTALEAAEKFLEKNFRIDSFGQVVRIDPRIPEYHDESIKLFIKNLYDEGKINKQENKLEDIIPQYYDYSKYNIQGFTLINKETGNPLFIQSEDFDEKLYSVGRFTQAQIEEVIYKPFKSNQYEKFKIEFDKRKQMKLEAENFGLGIYDM
tara:strand:- start:2157 stop:4007 length:1851 start_codon:yes stop_codon:yes gene_type:complete